MTDNTKHTPTPWERCDWVADPKGKSDFCGLHKVDTESVFICAFKANRYPISTADLDFILRAVNSHAAMREALEGFIDECASGNLVFRGYVEQETLAKASAALALARGDT